MILDKKQVAARIGSCVRKLEMMVNAGEFPPGVAMGKSQMWLEEVVDQWQILQFAPQREWIQRAAAAAGMSGAAQTMPSLREQSALAREEHAAPSRRSTTLLASGVPAPIRLGSSTTGFEL